jgi:hypothetical protein
MSWCCLGTAGAFAQNAFWADHWTYTLDLVHNYLAVYPDQEEVRALLLSCTRSILVPVFFWY